MELVRSFTAGLVVLLLVPAAALADGEVSIDDDDFAVFTAGAGDVNALSVNAEIDATGHATVVFTDTGATIESSECDGGGTGTVTCEGPLSGWSADLDDLADAVAAAGNLEGGMVGGAGDDVMSGSETNEFEEFLEGGDGNDRIFGRGGEDFAVGEDGSDLVDGGADRDRIGDAGGEGNDLLSGGAGFDTIVYTDTESPANDTFTVNLAAGFGGRTNFAAETDSLSAFEDVDTSGLQTNSAADVVTGSAGSNVVYSGDGADIVDPAGGADSVFSGAGNDAIETRDGENDRVDCGEGVDNVQADQFDELHACDVMGITPTRPAHADLDPPACTLAAVRSPLSRRAFLRGVTPRVDCNEAALLELELVVGAGLLAGAGDVVLAQGETAPGSNVRLKPARRLARRLPRRKGFRVRLEIEARDQFGNRSNMRKVIKVKRPPSKRRRR